MQKKPKTILELILFALKHGGAEDDFIDGIEGKTIEFFLILLVVDTGDESCTGMLRKHVRYNVAWFFDLRKTWLGNNVFCFAHLQETQLGNSISWFNHLQETWLETMFPGSFTLRKHG